MVLGKPGFLGAGSFSTVQRGLDLWTGKSVAIKQFKMSEMQKDLKTNVTKFKRQIEVLQYLMEPLKREEIVDPMLQHEYFWTVDPRKCFLELVDYSRQADGSPGPDCGLFEYTKEGKNDYDAEVQKVLAEEGLREVAAETSENQGNSTLAGGPPPPAAALDKEKAGAKQPPKHQTPAAHQTAVSVVGEKFVSKLTTVSASSTTLDQMFVVTEIADYSLKDYLTERLNEKKPMSANAVCILSKAFLIAMGMLHAKGLAHLDMKPENIMRAGETWKIIDVDGCTPLNKKVSINDSTISFSPCYCAPEWANFLVDEGEHCRVGHQLDVWSVGLSLCELITLDAVLKPQYMRIFKNAGSHRKAGFMFLQWLANPRQALSMSRKVNEHNALFSDLVLSKMLTKKPSERWSLAQCLRHEYLRDVKVPGLHVDILLAKEREKEVEAKRLRANEGPENRRAIIALNTKERLSVNPSLTTLSQNHVNALEHPADAHEHLGGKRYSTQVREKRYKRLLSQVDEGGTRAKDNGLSNRPPLLKGVLFKLHAEQDPILKQSWAKRDVWVTPDGKLCYFSAKTGKKLALLSHEQLAGSRIRRCSDGDRGLLLDTAVENADTAGGRAEVKNRRENHDGANATPASGNGGPPPPTPAPTDGSADKGARPEAEGQRQQVSALPFSFVIDLDGGRLSETAADGDHHALHDGVDLGKYYFAATDEPSLQNWLRVLDYARTHEDLTMDAANGMYKNPTKSQVQKLKQEFNQFRVQIRNRREGVNVAGGSLYQPVYSANLWKLNADGDAHRENDWLLRKMWLAKNGALCYYSEKEQKNLCYYRCEDVRYVSYRKMNMDESCRLNSFELQLRETVGGTSYAPGVFAAESEEVMQIFLGCIEKYQRIKAAKEKGQAVANGGGAAAAAPAATTPAAPAAAATTPAAAATAA